MHNPKTFANNISKNHFGKGYTMKKTLFGSFGELIKGNIVTIILALCVVGAAAMSFYTINDINEKLDNQTLPPNPVADSGQEHTESEAQDVQKTQQNVPLKESAKPKATPKAEKETEAKQQEETAAAKETAPGFILPVQGTIFAAFSGDELVYNKTMDDWRTHNGIDIRANRDVGVKAGADGKIKDIYEDGSLGWTVELDCGSFVAKYSGLGDNVMVRKGDSVKQGDTIGVVGEIPLETAEESHIHLEIIKDGRAVNPDTVLKQQ